MHLTLLNQFIKYCAADAHLRPGACCYCIYTGSAARRTQPRLVISGVTKLPCSQPQRQRAKGAKGSKVKKLMTAAFVQLNRPTVAVPIYSCSNVPNAAPVQYLNDKTGKAYTDLSAKEMVATVKTFLRERSAGEAPRSARRRQAVVLVLDKDRTHESKHFMEEMQKLGQRVIIQPARSYDLSPLDSHLFAVVKQKWRRQVQANPDWEWDDKATAFQDLLHSEDANAHIKDWKLRLEACIKCKGHRFEAEYKKMKKAANNI